nr:immunoglobulin heavy chain junction region [Macaca mulatta]MOW32711.1 immunoglobulin heavy chain junction region [Macaca mulatta]MOW32956.1 immunoglobulin heavy chain junction region [Macaca mulatta]MOW33157.1 immunoglobulin heavy chain junction region [Macaca mulatta]MOW33198.1 immunoglobulin heavy chain junction region [Macaca mulatta]
CARDPGSWAYGDNRFDVW